MDRETKKRIKENIGLLETDSALSPYDAERIFIDTLSPLLIDDGYEVIPIAPLQGYGVELFARRPATKEYHSSTLGVEYKHYRNKVPISAIHQAIGAAQVNFFDRAMIVTNSQFTSAALEIVRRDLPLKIELIDIIALKVWISKIEVQEDINQLEVEQIIKVVSGRFAELIAFDPRNLDNLEWRDIERTLAEVFEKIGFTVELTPGSKDGGKDIILECHVSGKKQSYIVEVKHWRSGSRVGKGAVVDFLNVIVYEKHHGGVYLSTYGYAGNAFESLTQIEREKLRFGNEEKIVSLCKTYMKVTSGIWSPQKSLIEVLYDDTV